MKSSLRLSAVASAVAAFVLLVPAGVRAADDDQTARRAQAEILLHAMHTEQVLTNSTGRVYQMVDKITQNLGGQGELNAEQKAAAKKAEDDAHTVIAQQLNWDALKGDFIQAYADAFTVDELKGLIAFYSSPLGQKLVEKQPAVTEKMGRLTQQKMMSVMPTIIQKLKESVQKSPMPAPAPTGAATSPAPTTPAASPAP